LQVTKKNSEGGNAVNAGNQEKKVIDERILIKLDSLRKENVYLRN
jgi:hypothetical protein